MQTIVWFKNRHKLKKVCPLLIKHAYSTYMNWQYTQPSIQNGAWLLQDLGSFRNCKYSRSFKAAWQIRGKDLFSNTTLYGAYSRPTSTIGNTNRFLMQVKVAKHLNKQSLVGRQVLFMIHIILPTIDYGQHYSHCLTKFTYLKINHYLQPNIHE